MKFGLGASQLYLIVRSSMISTLGGLPSTSSTTDGPPGDSSLLLATSSQKKRKSSVVNGSPSDQRWPARRWKVNSLVVLDVVAFEDVGLQLELVVVDDQSRVAV